MSVAEIIQEIPRLSLDELRVLAAKIGEMVPETNTHEMCDHLKTETTRLLIRLERREARRPR